MNKKNPTEEVIFMFKCDADDYISSEQRYILEDLVKQLTFLDVNLSAYHVWLNLVEYFQVDTYYYIKRNDYLKAQTFLENWIENIKKEKT